MPPDVEREAKFAASGPQATPAPVPAAVKVDRRSSVQDLLRNVIGGSTRRLIDHSLALRMNGGEPETIHQARVATRRLRSDLRTFRRLLDSAWVASLRDELRWLAGPLGEVRDLDVMVGRLEPVVESMAASDRPHGHALLAGLRTQRQEAMARLTAQLDDPRFVTLVDRLLDASEAPPVTDDANGKAAVALVPIVKHPWRRLRTGVRELDDPPTDQALHALRIDAKRLRYALEAAQPVLGKSAGRQAKAVADLQGVLGDLHDSVVAGDRLRALGDSYGDPQAALVVGTLIGWEHAQHEALRAQWKAKWEKASAKKLRRWMR
ncbi:MAG: domain containing protein [Acidimicrobiia bacterium]|nr:domain containing protein [Acidimicrobiia bacterium]